MLKLVENMKFRVQESQSQFLNFLFYLSCCLKKEGESLISGGGGRLLIGRIRLSYFTDRLKLNIIRAPKALILFHFIRLHSSGCICVKDFALDCYCILASCMSFFGCALLIFDYSSLLLVFDYSSRFWMEIGPVSLSSPSPPYLHTVNSHPQLYTSTSILYPTSKPQPPPPILLLTLNRTSKPLPHLQTSTPLPNLNHISNPHPHLQFSSPSPILIPILH